jgi:mRNA interferase HigB
MEYKELKKVLDNNSCAVIYYQHGNKNRSIHHIMKVLGKKYVLDFIVRHPDCKKSVEALVLEIKSADWKTPHDIKARYPKASIIGKSNVVFDICGNKYRIWLKITYHNGIAIVIKIGTHEEYDKWEIK